MKLKRIMITGIATLGMVAPTILGAMPQVANPVMATASASRRRRPRVHYYHGGDFWRYGHNRRWYNSRDHHSTDSFFGGLSNEAGDLSKPLPKRHLTKRQKMLRARKRARHRAEIRKMEEEQNASVRANEKYEKKVRARKKARKRARLHEDGEAERAYGQYESNSEKLQKAQKHHWSNAWQKTLKKRMKQEAKTLHYTPTVPKQQNSKRHVRKNRVRRNVRRNRRRGARRYHIVRVHRHHARRR